MISASPDINFSPPPLPAFMSQGLMRPPRFYASLTPAASEPDLSVYRRRRHEMSYRGGLTIGYHVKLPKPRYGDMTEERLTKLGVQGQAAPKMPQPIVSKTALKVKSRVASSISDWSKKREPARPIYVGKTWIMLAGRNKKDEFEPD